MTNKRFKEIILVCFFSLSLVTFGCSESSNEITAQPIKTETKPNSVHINEDTQSNYKDFKVFYTAFSNALKNSDWKYLAELTRFPFVLKGELDNEEKVALNRKKFMRSIEGLLKEEVYIDINDELIETNYQKIIFDLESYLNIKNNEAQLFGLLFINKADGWKLSEITTHIHIVEKYSKEK